MDQSEHTDLSIDDFNQLLQENPWLQKSASFRSNLTDYNNQLQSTSTTTTSKFSDAPKVSLVVKPASTLSM